MEALANGAVDFVTKKAAFKEMDSLKDELIEKITFLAKNSTLKNTLIRQRLLREMERMRSKLGLSNDFGNNDINDQSPYVATKQSKPGINDLKIVAIGISTGGPIALNELLKPFPGDFPVPIVVAQHMPPFFTKSLADRLDSISHLRVKEAEVGEKLERGVCYISPGGMQMTINKKNCVEVSEGSKSELYKPSVNVLVNSVVNVYGKSVLGVMMTGMGNDGTEGFKKLSAAGGYIIAQDPETCVVSGMTRSVIDARLANEIVTLANLSTNICMLFGKKTVFPKLIKKEFIR
jgi:two-component system chemotaxis response regulator CheB